MANSSYGSLKSPDSLRGQSSPPPDWQQVLRHICTVVYPFLLSGAVLALILLLAMIATKHTDASWLAQVNSTFSLLGGFGILCLLAVHYRNIGMTLTVLAFGIALNYMPAGMELFCRQVSQDPQQAIILSVGKTAQGLGSVFDIMAGVSLVYWFMLFFIRRDDIKRTGRIDDYNDEPVAKQSVKPSLLPKCWEMSRCRPSIRKYCPNYASRTPCWKRRGGCLCDQGVANQMISSSGRGEALEVIEMQQKANLNRGGDIPVVGARPNWNVQKHVCYSCPLFIEHQEYKFRNFNWLSFPITATIIALAFHLFQTGYAMSVSAIDKMLNTQLPIPSDSTMIHSPFEWVVLGIITVLIWSGVVNTIERVFMRWKL